MNVQGKVTCGRPDLLSARIGKRVRRELFKMTGVALGAVAVMVVVDAMIIASRVL